MTQKKKKTTGMVLGKFMPLHRGHELLLHFSAAYCDKLYAITEHQDAIDGARRCKWLRETVPSADVFYIDRPMPQAPEEHPDFWNLWRDTLRGLMPQKPDYVFASETYGHKLAEALGATFIPVDLARAAIPVSATMIRNDLYANWDYLSAAAKRDYLVRVLAHPDLAQALAAHFDTVAVPDYARTFIAVRDEDDRAAIAQGQAAIEAALAPRARRYLFCEAAAEGSTYPLDLRTAHDLATALRKLEDTRATVFKI